MADDEDASVRTKKFSNGDVYTGNWSPSGVPDGEGKYKWQDGSTYEGSWKDGAKHGIGRYTWPSGATYHGEWLSGSMHGVGTWESADGRCRYQGGWHQDTKHGLGRQVYASGDVYEGLWKLGSPWGPGRYVYEDGNEYDGEWRGGRMHGHGTFAWRTGERYDGQWKDGRMDGAGLFTAADGSAYDGHWRRGRKHGVGIFRPAIGALAAAGPGSGPLPAGACGPTSDTGLYGSSGGASRGLFAKTSSVRIGTRSWLSEGGGGGGSGGGANGAIGGDMTAAGALVSPFAGTATSPQLAHVVRSGPGGAAEGTPSSGTSHAPTLSPFSSLPVPFPSLPASTPDSPCSPMISLGPGPGPGAALAGMAATAAGLTQGATACHLHQFYPAHHQQQHPQQPADQDAQRQERWGAGGHARPHPLLASHPVPSDALADPSRSGSGSAATPRAPLEVPLPPLSQPAPEATQQQQQVLLFHHHHHHQQQQHVQQQCQPQAHFMGGVGSGAVGQLAIGGGGGAGSGGGGGGGGGKLVYVRMCDKGRLVRETALSPDDLEALLPGGLMALVRRGSLDRGHNQFLRLLRGGGAMMVGSGRPRAWPRLGDPVTQAHHSYALMVALQLGIRYSVGRISHQPLPRHTSAEEYSLRVQQEFPRGGSELTPVHPAEDFTWSDYAPVTFRRVRELFGVDASTYMLSLCSDQSLRHLASPGKSGSVFFLSQDERFFIKTMSRPEMEVLLAMLPAYHRHVDRHPHTLLCRFCGLHAVTTPGGRKYRFVVMSNILRGPLPLHRKFDLKGSTLGRTAGRPPCDDPTIIFKDLDLDLTFRLEDGWRDRLLFQLRADCGLLAGVGVMDYSLLVGLHFRGRAIPAGGKESAPAAGSGGGGAAEGGSGCGLGPSEPRSQRGLPSPSHYRKHHTAQDLEQEYARAEERIQRLGARLGLGEAATGDMAQLARMRMLKPRGRSRDPSTGLGHLTDRSVPDGPGAAAGAAGQGAANGGSGGGGDPGGVSVSVNDQLALSMGQSRVQLGVNMAATAVHKDGREEEAVLWFALIDILQPYNTTKRLEHGLKSVIHSAQSISVTHPNAYANRFQAFMKRVFE